MLSVWIRYDESNLPAACGGRCSMMFHCSAIRAIPHGWLSSTIAMFQGWHKLHTCRTAKRPRCCGVFWDLVHNSLRSRQVIGVIGTRHEGFARNAMRFGDVFSARSHCLVTRVGWKDIPPGKFRSDLATLSRNQPCFMHISALEEM